MKLWINDVRTNGYRVFAKDGAKYKYISTMDNADAKQQATAIAKKIKGTVEVHDVVLGNIDELDRDLGSLRVDAKLFVDADGDLITPEKRELFNFDAKDIGYPFDEETGERTSTYLFAKDFVLGEKEELSGGAGFQSVL